MKKNIALKISSHQEEISESSYKDEEDEMAMVVKSCKKLVLQKSQRIGRGNNSNKNQFKGDSSKSDKFMQNA